MTDQTIIPLENQHHVQSLQGQLSGTQCFIDYVKLFKRLNVLYSSGTTFLILCPRYETLSVPLQTVFTQGVSK